MPDDLVPPADRFRETPLAEALSERYLAYALSTITARSLPDVRDGLKPVHRRLLWAMHQLKLDPASGFKKCARIVGDVMGKYHPHGDASIYDAMVRLAQDFAARYMLVEGQGNFGNIDGDNPAAMRYTEAKLTLVAQAMLEGIEEDAVDFRATYDGEEQEPLVLPAGFPNLLANGANGIAVGMATSIPPHNAGELCAAALEFLPSMIARGQSARTAAGAPDLDVISDDALLTRALTHIKGPDFPTGGILVESAASMREAYATGRGGFRLRARWEQSLGKNGLWSIVVTEIPYQVQKSRLVEQIAQLLEEKKLPLLADLRDESTDKVRLVFEPRARTVDPAQLMESLFRATALEQRLSLNMNVLDARRTPRVMGLVEVLRSWLDHRQVVLVRRSQHRLSAIERRLEILAGYLIVYLNIDEVIRIIREEDEAKPALIKRFGLTDVQAEAVLNMRLRSLRRLEEIEIRREHDKLSKEGDNLRSLLADPKKQWRRIGQDIEATRKKFGEETEIGRRRTTTGVVPDAVALDETAFVEREAITVILTEMGWIRAQKGTLAPDAEVKVKDGDRVQALIPCETTDRLCLFATNGRAYTIRAETIPRGRGDGQPVRLLLDLGQEDAVVSLFVWRADDAFLLARRDGRGFVASAEDLLAEKRTGRTLLNLDPGMEAMLCLPLGVANHLAVIGDNRKLLVFPLDQVPRMQRGAGVRLQAYKDGGLADAKPFRMADGLSWRLGERVRTEPMKDWLGTRGSAGRMPPNGFPKSGRFSG